MRLSPADYLKGLLRWNKEGVAFWTSTADTPGSEPDWQGPLTDFQGSRVQSPARRYVELRAEARDNTALADALPARWERLVENTIVTGVWTASGRERKLTHLPNYGFFHRLVVNAQFLHWTDDAIIRVDDTVFRLVSGRIHGEEIKPIDEVTVEDGQLSIRGQESGLAYVEGKFIEIVAPGRSDEDAEQAAYSILGLAALALGEHAIGPIVFAEPYEATAEAQLGRLRIPVTARLPREAQDVELTTIDLLLPLMLSDSRMGRARKVALRWYERGIRSEGALDKIISFFIGIEAIVNAYAAESGPLPEVRERRERFSDVLEALAAKIDQATLSQVAQRLTDATAADRFRFYAVRHDWPDELLDTFRRLAKTRNDALHGDVVNATWKDERDAKDLMEKLLKAEFGLLGDLPKVPAVTRLTIEYALVGDDNESPDQPADSTLA